MLPKIKIASGSKKIRFPMLAFLYSLSHAYAVMRAPARMDEFCHTYAKMFIQIYLCKI
ncbi:MAG: hypothetical protein ACI8XG_000527 [Congregibacter sp.]|jgi:hypothetical protein